MKKIKHIKNRMSAASMLQSGDSSLKDRVQHLGKRAFFPLRVLDEKTDTTLMCVC